jgi:hypothetical protein
MTADFVTSANTPDSEGRSSGVEGEFSRRIESVLGVAGDFQTGVPLAELAALSPAESSLDESELRNWLEARPGIARLEGDRVFSPNSTAEGLEDRNARAERYLRAASLLWKRTLAPLIPLTVCVAISGSTAYGGPRAGDDLDFFVVTRRGALWVVLVFAALAGRPSLRAWLPTDRPRPCFNYVLEEGAASKDFENSRGFAFAREALSVLVLHGEEYYQRLLGCGKWMKNEIPRLYSARRPASRPIRERSAPWPVRIASGLLFPVGATYLFLMSLRANARARANDHSSGEMVAEPGLRRVAMRTSQFERLRVRYGDIQSVGRASRARPASNCPLAAN